MLQDDSYDLILLDELNIALKYEYIDLDRVLDDLQAVPKCSMWWSPVVTPQELIDIADTVTDMRAIKHAFKDQASRRKKVLNCK